MPQAKTKNTPPKLVTEPVDFDALLATFKGCKARIAIMGMGYVGFPLAIATHAKGYDVLAFDVDTKKIAEVLFTEEKLMEKLGEENIAELAGQVKAEALIDEVAEPMVRKIKRKIVLKTYAKPSPEGMVANPPEGIVANPPEGMVANPERMANQPEGLVAKRGPSIVIRRPKP
jgi:hypothetical protein